MTDKVRIAILDDYQGVALKLADWSRVMQRAEVDVFHDHLSDLESLVARLGALPGSVRDARAHAARPRAARALAEP